MFEGATLQNKMFGGGDVTNVPGGDVTTGEITRKTKHLGEKYVCDKCGKALRSRSGLWMHTKTVHVRKFKHTRTICLKSFQQRDHYVGHTNRHIIYIMFVNGRVICYIDCLTNFVDK